MIIRLSLNKLRRNAAAQMDGKIATLIDNTTELESAVYVTEEFQDDTIDKIATATRYKELSTAKPQC